MGEISAASNEQSVGVAQIGEAVTQMDHATQQNAALVEEMAAAASSLKGQAQELVQTVSAFKLDAQSATGVPSLPSLAVRSSAPKNLPYKGVDRRLIPRPETMAQKAQAAAAQKTSKPASPAPAANASAKPAAKPAAVAAAGGGNDSDWETF
jgi:hypothetical protein